MSQQHFQVAVLGSGFAGSLMAMIAHRLGLATALLERGRHPRFAIGESSTPLANLLLEQLARDYELPFLAPLCKWGTWQKQLPQLACGLKRGFTFYHHQLGKPFDPHSTPQNQLLVGASPNEEVADTHWYRAELDQYLAHQAQKLGVTYLDECVLTNASEQASGVVLSGGRRGQPVEITAEFVIDASGPRGFLHRTLGLQEAPFPGFPQTQALFSHFINVGSLESALLSNGHKPPYPPDQSAEHHIFPGGWIWVLRFNNGVTSAGVAVAPTLAAEFDFSSGDAAWRRLLARLPSLGEMFNCARATLPFIHIPRLPFRSGIVAGTRWALLPSAAGFVDPLLSTGFPLTLLGVERLGQLVRSSWQRPTFEKGLAAYSQQTMLELDTAAALVNGLYGAMDRFELFKQLSLLYFTAASYAETVRRLGKPHLADGFLLCNHRSFSRQLQEICEDAGKPVSRDQTERLRQKIRNAIEPFDIAGFTDASRDPWYPATPSDLLRNSGKVGAVQSEIRTMLSRCGLRAT